MSLMLMEEGQSCNSSALHLLTREYSDRKRFQIRLEKLSQALFGGLFRDISDEDLHDCRILQHSTCNLLIKVYIGSPNRVLGALVHVESGYAVLKEGPKTSILASRAWKKHLCLSKDEECGE